jgi:hypothetical protein
LLDNDSAVLDVDDTWVLKLFSTSRFRNAPAHIGAGLVLVARFVLTR